MLHKYSVIFTDKRKRLTESHWRLQPNIFPWANVFRRTTIQVLIQNVQSLVTFDQKALHDTDINLINIERIVILWPIQHTIFAYEYAAQQRQ